MSRPTARAKPRLSTGQQERSRETRWKLMKAAEDLWRSKGFDQTTVSDVCQQAGVSKGTFYFYFPHKEDLLLELGASTTDRVAADAIAAQQEDRPVAEMLRIVTDGIARRVSRTRRDLLARTLTELYRQADHWSEYKGERPDFRSIFEAVFRRAQDRGEIPLDFAPRELAAVMAASVNTALLAWARDQADGVSLEKLLWRRAAIVLNGARGGIEGLDRN